MGQCQLNCLIQLGTIKYLPLNSFLLPHEAALEFWWLRGTDLRNGICVAFVPEMAKTTISFQWKSSN